MKPAALALICLALLGCVHRESPRPSTPEFRPDVKLLTPAEVAGALVPCRSDLVAMSVREARSKDWLEYDCLTVKGRLEPVVYESQCLDYVDDRDGAPAAPKCTGASWMLTNDEAPPVVHLVEGDKGLDEAISLDAVALYEPFFLPIENCNRDAANKRIMPARSKMWLPPFSPEEAAAVGRALASKTVAVFGSRSPKLGESEFKPSAGPVTRLVFGYVCLLGEEAP